MLPNKEQSNDSELKATLKVQRRNMDSLKSILRDQFLIGSGEERAKVLHDLFYAAATCEAWKEMDQDKREHISFHILRMAEFFNDLDRYRDIIAKN